MRKKVNKYFFSGSSGNVFRGFITLALGSGIARLISIVAIPILTRIYSPEDFGILATFSALVAILVPIVTLRYTLAIPLPKHDGTAFNILVLSIIIMLISSIILISVLAISSDILLTQLSMKYLLPWWWLIGLAVIVITCYELLTSWATRQRSYKVIAKANVLQSATGSLVKLIFGMISASPLGLLIGDIVTKSGGSYQILNTFLSEFKINWKYVRLSRIKVAAWRFRGFPLYRVPSQFLMVFSVRAPALFVPTIFGASIAGQLGLAIMALALPVSILGQTTANAFYAEAAVLGKNKPKQIKAMLIPLLINLGLLALPITIVLFFFGSDIFRIAFGEEWKLAGVFSSSLSIYLFFQFLQAPVAHIFYIFDGQRALLGLNIQRALLTAGVFIWSYLQSVSVETTISTYALIISIHYALSIFYAIRYIPQK